MIKRQPVSLLIRFESTSSIMLILVAVVLLAVGASQAQMNQTCCPPSFSALGYHGLLGIEFDYYYSHLTRDTLTVDRHGDLVILGESLTGRIYTRKLAGDTCTYREIPQFKNMSNCVSAAMHFAGAVSLDGQIFYEWHEEHVPNLDAMAFVDEACLTKILYTSLHGIPVVSQVLFNHVPNANVDIISRFDKTDCVAEGKDVSVEV
ncbi:hypothetical protein EGW08_017195 [Elysia chlorotica]|uniref:Sema domain-containing protein n=1 Tax=Elysia chlorotica TaxID=188477 RepID=A0A433T0H1_ELYCH|nr:hypothetical protein EGW08_017195 [Elysia chlorotica]